MRKSVRNIIICLGIISIPLIGICSYIITLRPYTSSTSHIEIKNESKNEVKTNSTIKENSVNKKNNARLEVAASMHLMANGLVVAELS